MIAGGAMAIVLFATLAVTLTPRSSDPGLVALSATTVPRTSAAESAFSVAEAMRSTPLTGMSGVPSAVADVPAGAFGRATKSPPSAMLPDLDDQVIVLTDRYAYRVSWRDVSRLAISVDAIVVDQLGAVVAHIDDGRLVVSHDLMVGAAFAAD